jgi:hypothetical protein
MRRRLSVCSYSVLVLVSWLLLGERVHAERVVLPPPPTPITNLNIPRPPGFGPSSQDSNSTIQPHRSIQQSNDVFISQSNFASRAAALKSNPRASLTNSIDPIEQSLQQAADRLESELSDPNLNPIMRKTYEGLLADRKAQLADHQTNAQLWAHVHLAHQHHDLDQAAQADQALADYLGAKLGRIQGKSYPAGVSLSTVLADYRKQGGVSVSAASSPHNVLRLVVIVAFIIPPIVIGFFVFKMRFSRPPKM